MLGVGVSHNCMYAIIVTNSEMKCSILNQLNISLENLAVLQLLIYIKMAKDLLGLIIMQMQLLVGNTVSSTMRFCFR